MPFQVFAEKTGVSRIVAETPAGAFGLLPRRRDCVAALAAGIFIYETAADGEVCVAVDEGVLVKVGPLVLVSVRRAHGGASLDELRESVDRDLVSRAEREASMRGVVAKLEAGLLHRVAGLRHD